MAGGTTDAPVRPQRKGPTGGDNNISENSTTPFLIDITSPSPPAAGGAKNVRLTISWGEGDGGERTGGDPAAVYQFFWIVISME